MTFETHKTQIGEIIVSSHQILQEMIYETVGRDKTAMNEYHQHHVKLEGQQWGLL